MTRNPFNRPWLASLSAALAVLLAACGGSGIGSGGTGSAMALGTVDGFGSIFIGGERCDDVGARFTYDTVPGGPEPAAADIKLGQRVEAELDGASAACKILVARISPELVGVVSATSPLTVAGAQVLVNDDPLLGPVTVFDGYDSAGDIQLGDRVEVHGKAVAVSSGVAVRATRIERKPSTDSWVRVAGVIRNLDTTALTFTLGELTVNYTAGTTIVPAGVGLANGQTVAMWSIGAVVGNAVDARFIRVLRRNFPNEAALRVEGPISGCNGANPCTEPVIDGVQVLITSTTRFTWGRASDVVDGRTMHVRGTFDTASGKLVATAVAVRRFDPNAGVVTLLGTVSEFASAASETHFRVRGVPVATDGSTNFGCVVDDGKLVAVAGHIVGSSVLATRIECPALAVGTVVDAYAQVSQLDASARTFKLGNVGPLLSLATLQWDDHTLFGNGLTADALADGQYVAVRGVYLGGGRFLLLRVILDDTPPTSPTGGAVFRTIGIVHHITGTSLVVNRIPMAIVSGATVPLQPDVVNGTVVRAWFYRDVPNARWVALLVRPAPLF
jgi:hypothetical protein